MMTSLLFLSMLSPVYGQSTDDLKRDMQALEIFLQDKKDHETHCPDIEWEQPDIKVYKKELESQLPKECKQ